MEPSRRYPRRTSPLRLLLVASAVLVSTAVVAPSAGAVHWPHFGGDGGRSGYQPVDEGGAPVLFAYSKTGAAEEPVRTSVLTSASQRMIFGTASGAVHVQDLATGAPIGPEAGIDIEERNPDADVFGSGAGSVSFAETSGAGATGQVFAVHNDDFGSQGDIEIAQVDLANGALVQQQSIEGTNGYTINSSLVTTGPAANDPATPGDETGNRVLFFVAANGSGEERLFRVPVTGNAALATAAIGTATSTADVNANPVASATVLFLDQAGVSTGFVAVGTTDNRVKTFRVADLAAGPVSGDLIGPAQTPSVPVQPTGFIPNPVTGPVTTAPFVYVAAATNGATTTRVFKLRFDGTGLATVAASDDLDGAPAPALAVTQESEVSLADGKLVVTTGANLHLLSSADLDMAGRLSRTPLAPGDTGFAQTTAAASGDLVYATNDSGAQLVLRLSDGKPVSGADFTADPASAPAAGTGFGQPSVSRGFVQFGGRGVFVYRNADLEDPLVSISAPAADERLAGRVALRATTADERGVASVTFGLNGVRVGTDSSGEPSPTPGEALFSLEVDSSDLRNGNYVLVAQAKDASGRTALSEGVRVTILNLAPGDCANESRGTAVGEGLRGTAAGDTLLGLGGADTLRGLARVDCLYGGTGNDRLDGGPGDDRVLIGDAGADRIVGAGGADRLFGATGADRLFGSPGADVLSGGAGGDRLTGSSGGDGLFGGSGDDRLDGGSGLNTYAGGSGNDLILARNGRFEAVSCGSGRDRVRADRRDRLQGCERRIR